MTRIRNRTAIAAPTLAAALALFAGPALAKPPPAAAKCGDTLTSSVKLTHDLTNCAGDGLIIGAPGITVDLNGHTIDGTVAQTDCDRPDVLRAAVRNVGFDGVTIKDGTVQQFDEGVGAGSDAAGMSDSRVHHLTAKDNRHGGIDLGSGAGAAATANNVVDHNAVAGSRCGGGIKVNTGQANRVTDNRVQDSGIVVCCGDASDGNLVARNSVSGGDDFGIVVFSTGNSRVVGNRVTDVGDGILISGRSSNAIVKDNAIERVQGAGIVVESCCGEAPDVPTDLQITGNTLAKVAHGIILFETDRAVLRRNSVAGAGTFGDPDAPGVSIVLDGASGTLVRRNTITGGRGPGIVVGVPPEFDPSSRPVTDNVLARNTVSGQGADGIFVAPIAQDTTVRHNTTDRNGADGINVLSPSTTLKGNTANRNAAYGIEAVAGVTDGGGNHASGNGNPAQCTLGVACN
jgi:parallel beta-helix repeat protein